MTLKHTHLIWDFNGTILQDIDLAIGCTNTMLAARDLPVFPSLEVYREVFDFPIVSGSGWKVTSVPVLSVVPTIFISWVIWPRANFIS